MITEAVKEVLPAGKGVEVTISAPEGANIAKKTMNAKLGITGGVSILGTTGVVKPLSLEACRRSLGSPNRRCLRTRLQTHILCPRKHWRTDC